MHNLENDYDGRLSLQDTPSSHLAALHQLPIRLLIQEGSAVVMKMLRGGSDSCGDVDRARAGGIGTAAPYRRRASLESVRRETPCPCIQLTRAALLCCHSWGTVSPSYCTELMATSPYAPLLELFGTDGSIACHSGLPIRDRRVELAAFGAHDDAKAVLQRRCFGDMAVDRSAPLLMNSSSSGVSRTT